MVGGSSTKYVRRMRNLGAQVFSQEEQGMGNARRQALRQAREIASGTDVTIWMEPEKHTLVPLLEPVVGEITSGGNDMVLFQRESLDSYPPEQAHAYQMGALAFEYLTKIKCDFLFGPVALSSKAIDYFLTYKSKFGDLWDSIHIPKFRIMHAGLPWTQVLIKYEHPTEQTEAEQGDMGLFMKRIDQMKVITGALIAEINDLSQQTPERGKVSYSSKNCSSFSTL